MKRLILALILILLSATSCLADWTVDGLTYTTRIKLTIDQTKVDADLVDLPVLVKLTDARFDWTHSNADGFDIRFTASDGSTLLKYERERHDGADYAEYWVKVPAVSGTVNTDCYLYYRTTDTADGADPTNVWDANYVTVQHLSDLTTSTTDDSTSYGYNGTKRVAGEPTEITANIVNGQDFLATADDYINCGDITQIDASAYFTFSAWVQVHSDADASGSVINKRDSATAHERMGLITVASRNIRATTANTANTYGDTAVNAFVFDEWNLWTMVFDGTQVTNAASLKFYLNAVQQSLTFTGTIPDTTANIAAGVEIGILSTTYGFNGIIDEVRITNDVRTAAEVKADYYSGNDSLLTYGAEETPPGAGQVIIITGDD